MTYFEAISALEPTARRARALVAWLSADERQRLGLNGDGSGPAAALAARPPEVDQRDLLAPLPDSLAGHADALRRSDGARGMFAEGGELVLVTDLRRVIAAQPTVLVDPVGGPLTAVDDLAAIARITLPLSPPTAEIPAHFDADRQAWIITSGNPNLRITGRFGAEVEPNVLGFGFLLRVLTSFVSVVEYRGRYILRDGYHRTYGLLAADITAAPAFVHRLADDAPPFRDQMLPEEVYCGERPPTLQDYHDDRLSEELEFEPPETTVVVHAGPTSLVSRQVA